MKKEEKAILQQREDLLTLCDLARAVLDSSDAKAYCKGIDTTISVLEKIVSRIEESVGC